jgi:hypothetical protein
MPMTEPIAETRSISHHSFSVSVMPSRQPLPSVLTSAIEDRWRMRSMISGMAKKPSARTTNGTPSLRYVV